MVSRLSDMRMQLSTMEKQRADAAAEHEAVRASSPTRASARRACESP